MPCQQKRVAKGNLTMANIEALRAGAAVEGIDLKNQQDGSIELWAHVPYRNITWYSKIGVFTPGSGLDIYIDRDTVNGQKMEGEATANRNRIARAVSNGAVALQAKKYGWAMEKDAQGRFVVQKGR